MVANNDCPDEKVALARFPGLHLISNTPKGRGVFAGRDIPSGSVIDVCAVLVLDPVENVKHIENTSLYHYTYNWPTSDADGKPKKTQASIFGLGSMFNHSSEDQNVGWKRDLEHQLVTYSALRDIREGEELCISYGDHLTFVDADAPAQSGWIERPEDVLANIELD
ncbi:hypothetical protein LTR36_004914 [Oleoguttula mirabilis]|uniref:SET domain-containing protein n=1 Tax=Oleoguttula mirabilis TaxID=1507867 RepID=A0AAV9JWX0_9PEZI|nr:hypothetical protein LTR36_004914 [Oleoguttula mirabilis]